MERVETEGQIATAHTLARILSTIPLSVEGPAKLVIYDIHTLQVYTILLLFTASE
jgi:hypothetical protein